MITKIIQATTEERMDNENSSFLVKGGVLEERNNILLTGLIKAKKYKEFSRRILDIINLYA